MRPNLVELGCQISFHPSWPDGGHGCNKPIIYECDVSCECHQISSQRNWPWAQDSTTTYNPRTTTAVDEIDERDVSRRTNQPICVGNSNNHMWHNEILPRKEKVLKKSIDSSTSRIQNRKQQRLGFFICSNMKYPAPNLDSPPPSLYEHRAVSIPHLTLYTSVPQTTYP